MLRSKLVRWDLTAIDHRSSAEREQRQFPWYSCYFPISHRHDLERQLALSQNTQRSPQNLRLALMEKAAIIEKLFAEQSQWSVHMLYHGRNDCHTVRSLRADDEKLFPTGEHPGREQVQLKALKDRAAVGAQGLPYGA